MPEIRAGEEGCGYKRAAEGTLVVLGQLDILTPVEETRTHTGDNVVKNLTRTHS